MSRRIFDLKKNKIIEKMLIKRWLKKNYNKKEIEVIKRKTGIGLNKLIEIEIKEKLK